MRRFWLLLLTLMALLPGGVAAAPGGARLALVIANGSEGRGGGERIAATLSGVGFVDAAAGGAVQPRRDLDDPGMTAALAGFRERLAAAGPRAFGVLYVLDHGGAAPDQVALTRSLLGTGAHGVLIVLDLGREGPGGSVTAPTARGLARILRVPGSGVRPDQGYVVATIRGDDGSFPALLAAEVGRPQQSIVDALKRAFDRAALAGDMGTPIIDIGLPGAPPCFVSCDAAAGERFVDCAGCPYMRVVPPGTGVIGSPAGESERGADERAQAGVTIARPFAIGAYEVTVAEWAACARDRACRPIGERGTDTLLPVTGLAYGDAQAFVAWASARSGLPYRLPTEQEWEYADRAGATTAFPWGGEIAASKANYDTRASYRGSRTAPYRGHAEAVNAYPPNAFGLYQMQGNAAEWTAGCGDAGCASHVLRGGSYRSGPAELRAAHRVAATDAPPDAGLRVARDLAPDETGD